MNTRIVPSLLDKTPLQCYKMPLQLPPSNLSAASLQVPAIYLLRFIFLMQVNDKSVNLEITPPNFSVVSELNLFNEFLCQEMKR